MSIFLKIHFERIDFSLWPGECILEAGECGLEAVERCHKLSSRPANFADRRALIEPNVTTFHWSSWHLSTMALIFCTFNPHETKSVSMKQILRQWNKSTPINRFLANEKDSTHMKQSPLPLKGFFHNPVLFHPRNRIILVISFLISQC